MIIPAIYNKIETILQGVSQIKQIKDHPTPNITQYPCALFYPVSMENAYETTTENFKSYTFKLFIVIGTRGNTVGDIMRESMPKTVDAVLQALDDGWNFSTIENHRAWTQVSIGSWQVVDMEGGIEVIAEFDLTVKLLTTNS